MAVESSKEGRKERLKIVVEVTIVFKGQRKAPQKVESVSSILPYSHRPFS